MLSFEFSFYQGVLLDNSSFRCCIPLFGSERNFTQIYFQIEFQLWFTFHDYVLTNFRCCIFLFSYFVHVSFHLKNVLIEHSIQNLKYDWIYSYSWYNSGLYFLNSRLLEAYLVYHTYGLQLVFKKISLIKRFIKINKILFFINCDIRTQSLEVVYGSKIQSDR